MQIHEDSKVQHISSNGLQRGKKSDGLRRKVDFMQKAYTLKIRGGAKRVYKGRQTDNGRKGCAYSD